MKVKFLVLGVAGMLAVAAAASAARLDVVYGTACADTLAGTTGADVIYARAGSDTVRATCSNDVVYGGAGNDVLMWPVAGVDVQYGRKGNDVLHALANDNEPDILDCGPGFDTAIVISTTRPRSARAPSTDSPAQPGRGRFARRLDGDS